MNEELKKRWVEALRSGRYPQGKGLLRDVNGNYCCLGVLEEIREKNIDPFATMPDQHDLVANVGLEWNMAVSLAEQNDDGIPFDEIADSIEYNV